MRKVGRSVFLALLVFMLFRCQEQAGVNDEGTEAGLADSFNFDSILHCYDFSWLDHYFYTADYGCIYEPVGINRFGNLLVYLVPHQSIDSAKADSVATALRSMDITGIKKDFQPYVFVIPPGHLHYNASADPVYYPKESYVERLYGFDSGKRSWKLIDSISVVGDVDREKEQNWRERFIKDKVRQ